MVFSQRSRVFAGSQHTNMAILGLQSRRVIKINVQQALEDRPISQGKFVRLNLGLSAFATLNILVLSTSLVSPEGAIEYPGRCNSNPIVKPPAFS